MVSFGWIFIIFFVIEVYLKTDFDWIYNIMLITINIMCVWMWQILFWCLQYKSILRMRFNSCSKTRHKTSFFRSSLIIYCIGGFHDFRNTQTSCQFTGKNCVLCANQYCQVTSMGWRSLVYCSFNRVTQFHLASTQRSLTFTTITEIIITIKEKCETNESKNNIKVIL